MTTPPWVPRVTGLPDKKRVLANDYLQARGEAFESHEHLDPVVEIELSPTRRPSRSEADQVHMHTILWLTFMAGSDWERRYRGRRYADETTSTT